jgi:hypothetical protein
MKSRSAAARLAIRSNTRRCIWIACTRAFIDRLEELRRGQVSPEKYLVPGARALIEALRERGLRLYLASGTDQPYMREEAALLDVARYFEGRVYGALDDYKQLLQEDSDRAPDRRVRVPGRGISGLRRWLRGNREHQGGGRRGGGRGYRRARVPHGGRVEAPAAGGRGRRLHHPQLSRAATNCSPRCFPMASKYPLFDRSRLLVKPLAERVPATWTPRTGWRSMKSPRPTRTRPAGSRGPHRRMPASVARPAS